MNPIYFLAPFTILAGVAIAASAFVRVARLRSGRPELLSEVAERMDALERDVQALQQELAEAQERLDFAERVLGKAREERRLGG